MIITLRVLLHFVRNIN